MSLRGMEKQIKEYKQFVKKKHSTNNYWALALFQGCSFSDQRPQHVCGLTFERTFNSHPWRKLPCQTLPPVTKSQTKHMFQSSEFFQLSTGDQPIMPWINSPFLCPFKFSCATRTTFHLTQSCLPVRTGRVTPVSMEEQAMAGWRKWDKVMGEWNWR